MERWTNKVAVVTGASSGIGAATVVELVKAGVIVVGLARRQERIEELKKDVPESLQKNLHAIKCDVSKEEQIISTFAAIEKQFGGVDILINNAGILRETTLLDSNNSVPIREVIDTNILGLVFCTREAIRSMRERNVDGHIVHINSIAGHYIPIFNDTPSMNIYPASKHAVTALTETLRQDLNKLKLKIKVTSISPGAVKTEIFTPSILESIESGKIEFPFLESVDIADAILYVLSTPPRVQVHEIIIKPVGEQF